MDAPARAPSHARPRSPQQLTLLPLVSAETRALVVGRINTLGSRQFTQAALTELEHDNAELLFMAHNFASDQYDYARVMQDFALLFACLSAEAAQERGVLH